MYDERELTVEQIGEVLGVSRTSIYRAIGAGPAAARATRPYRTESQPTAVASSASDLPAIGKISLVYPHAYNLTPDRPLKF